MDFSGEFVLIRHGDRSFNEPLKATHHHVPGFFHPCTLPIVTGLVTAVLIDNEEHQLSSNTIFNWSFDGFDFIGAPQRYVVGDFVAGAIVRTLDGRQIGVLTKTLGRKWPIFTGFDDTSVHFSDVESVSFEMFNSSRPINYAGFSFESKSSLVDYIKKTRQRALQSSRVLRCIHRENAIQLILFENSLNVINVHIRIPSV